MSRFAIDTEEPGWMGRVLDEYGIEDIDDLMVVHYPSSPPFWIAECPQGATYHEADDSVGPIEVLADHRERLNCPPHGTDMPWRHFEAVWGDRDEALRYYRNHPLSLLDDPDEFFAMDPACDCTPSPMIVVFDGSTFRWEPSRWVPTLVVRHQDGCSTETLRLVAIDGERRA